MRDEAPTSGSALLGHKPVEKAHTDRESLDRSKGVAEVEIEAVPLRLAELHCAALLVPVLQHINLRFLHTSCTPVKQCRKNTRQVGSGDATLAFWLKS